MYWVVLIGGVVIVGAGWAAYAIYEWKMQQEEKNRPREKSERLQNVKKSLDDYAQKMAEFSKKKPYERKDQQ